MSTGWALFLFVTAVLAAAWVLTEVTIRVQEWLEARNDAEDADYNALREKGMGSVRFIPDDGAVYANPYQALSPERLGGES